jgi:predicted TIM-barrel fold metal-dependent hydrolase
MPATPALPLDAADAEPVLWPDLPIVDPHHHLFRADSSEFSYDYLAPDLIADLDTGHSIVATVFVEVGSAYRTSGPDVERVLGETEFVVDQAALDGRVAKAIVGHVDLAAGPAVGDVLDAHVDLAAGRFRGVRQVNPYDPEAQDARPQVPLLEGVLDQPSFRTGFSELGRRGLSFDAWCYHSNIGHVTSLARAYPDTRIVLDHIGSPLGTGTYRAEPAQVFNDWRTSMQELSLCDNVVVKFGGLGMNVVAAPLYSPLPRSPEQLASDWQPWFAETIESFGSSRVMFESNFPVDRPALGYRDLWSAFKNLVKDFSPDERTALFSENANVVYRLGL